MQNQITLFQRFKNYVNSLPVGATYTTDDLYYNVGRYESETMWKRENKQRMYRTSTYQTYLKRLGALEKIKRGKWKVLHHIPEWFYSKHINFLLGYERNDWSLDYMLDQGMPRELAERVHIPKHERINPFDHMIKPVFREEVTIDVELLKALYANATEEQREKLQIAYPKHFETYFDFGSKYELTTYSGGPLMIGKRLAPDGFEHKCLLVTYGYELRTIEENGYTFLSFVEKQ